MSETMMSPIPGTYKGVEVYCLAIDAYWEHKDHYDMQNKYFVLNDPNKTKHYVVRHGIAEFMFNYDTNQFESIVKKKDIKAIYTEEEWFAKEISYISVNTYVGTKFYAGRLLNLDAVKGEDMYHIVIVPVDEFCVEVRGMGFEVVRLESLVKQLPEGWSMDRCDLQLKTPHTTIDGQLDELIMESKPLHEHLNKLYNNNLGYAFNW